MSLLTPDFCTNGIRLPKNEWKSISIRILCFVAWGSCWGWGNSLNAVTATLKHRSAGATMLSCQKKEELDKPAKRLSGCYPTPKLQVLIRLGLSKQDPGRATGDLVNALFVFHLRWGRLPDELHFARLPGSRHLATFVVQGLIF